MPMTQILMDAAVCAVDIFAGTTINYLTGKAAKKHVAEKVKPEDFATEEEYKKAPKMASIKANVTAAGIATLTSVGLAAGSAYVICDVIPGMCGEDATDTETTETSTETEFI